MNAINGQPYRHYGLIFCKIEGVLDMPSRIGNTLYDWGDYLQPLVSKEDIFWKDRDIKVDAFFDGHQFGMNLEECLTLLKSLPKEFTLKTNFGDFKVKLKQVLKIKGYTVQYARLKLIFNENIPCFNPIDIKTPIGGNGVKIDGFDLFNDFGIVVSASKLVDDISILKQSNVTVFNAPKPFTENRTIRTVQLSCQKVYNDPLELRETIGKLKKILSQEATRKLFYNGRSYSCFLSEGFNVKFYGRNRVTFSLSLNIATNFVELGFIKSTFIRG